MQKKRWRINKGDSTNYLTRAACLRKLGVSLADFRKLCILKGIYPRTPSSKNIRKDKVYYHKKDILRIAKDDLVNKLNESKIIDKKIKKAIGKGEKIKAKIIDENRDSLDLNQIIRERYPSFINALQDLDDALSFISLFAFFQTDVQAGITGKDIFECQELMNQWYALIAELKCLKKVFASIKGYYFQVELLSVNIVWNQPHEFAQNKPEEVDFKVMSTFLLLYKQLMKFVLYKLYQLAGFKYPPSKKFPNIKSDGRFLNLSLEHSTEPIPIIRDNFDKILNLTSDDRLSMKRKTLFEKNTFYVSNETPKFVLVFILKSFGAQIVGFDEIINDSRFNLSKIDMNDERITHHICDRPLESMSQLLNSLGYLKDLRSFVQPQWVFDSVNAIEILPEGLYGPGHTLVPHLSPFDQSVDLKSYVALDKSSNSQSLKQDEDELADHSSEDEETKIKEMILTGKKRAIYKKLKARDQVNKDYTKNLKKKKLQNLQISQ